MSLLNTIRFITGHPLNRRQKLRAVLRFAKWQVGSRLISGDIVHEWIDGSKFFVRAGETGLTGNIYTDLHEFSDMAFLLHFLRDDDLFVDVGANVGSYTILGCAVAGARGVAFEPVPTTYKRLIENLRLNHLENRVEAVNAGVGSQPGSLRFTSDEDTMNHILADSEVCANPIDVGVVTLDRALEGRTPSLLKIDVEGYELPVLQGANETLSSHSLRAVIMELNGSGERYGFDESKIVDLMREHGFNACSYEPFDRRLAKLDRQKPDSGNTLFIRDMAVVADRLKNADRLSISGQSF